MIHETNHYGDDEGSARRAARRASLGQQQSYRWETVPDVGLVAVPKPEISIVDACRHPEFHGAGVCSGAACPDCEG